MGVMIRRIDNHKDEYGNVVQQYINEIPFMEFHEHSVPGVVFRQDSSTTKITIERPRRDTIYEKI